MKKIFFASDNTSAAHPAILSALSLCNSENFSPAYGNDSWTEKFHALVRSEFGEQASGYLVFNGTAANVASLAHLLSPWQAVLAAEESHLVTDECGALERFSGSKVIPLATEKGKFSPDSILEKLHRQRDIHAPQIKIVSFSQATEWGTVYSTAEIEALADFCHANNLLLHMDGARLANAAAYLNVSLGECSTKLGVDILSLGGTKNGLLFGDAVIFRDNKLSENFPFVQKQAMQLASKSRFLAAQFVPYLADKIWLQNAKIANQMAISLTSALEAISEISLIYPTQANGVFAKVPPAIAKALNEHVYFYQWGKDEFTFRFMTSWQTSAADITELSAILKKISG